MENIFMKIPIVMAAFGTTGKALETYSFIDEKCKKRFPEHEIFWAFSSRMVKDLIKKSRNIDLLFPNQVLSQLKAKGYLWAVVQSVHLTCGHEFYRLVEDVKGCDIRTSIGLPLLSNFEDYIAVVRAMQSAFCSLRNEAVVMVGHGTDHPSCSSYAALQYMLNQKSGGRIYIGVIEDGWPSMEEVVESVKKSGYKKIRLVPFLLVAGIHFKEDLIGKEDSWKTCFEREQISVVIENKGLGFNNGIVDIFFKHIEDAIDVIPVS